MESALRGPWLGPFPSLYSYLVFFFSEIDVKDASLETQTKMS